MAQTVISSQPVGSKLEAVVDVTGPSLYVTGGVSFSLDNYNVGGISAVEYVGGGATSNGTYYVYGRPPSGNAVATSSYKLVWIVAATGAEAGAIDLSGSTVRILVKGY